MSDIASWARRSCLLSLLLVVACGGPTGDGTQEDDDVSPPALCLTDDPDTVAAWTSRRDHTLAGLLALEDELEAAGQRPVDVDAYETTEGVRYSSVWRSNDDGRDWALHADLTSAEYHALWEEYREMGLRPVDVEADFLGGSWRYAGIWVENCEGLAWASYRNLTAQQFADYRAQYEGTHCPIDVEVTPGPSGPRHCVIWQENVDDLDWALHLGLDSKDLTDNDEAYTSLGQRMLDLEVYGVAGTDQLFAAAIWVENRSGRASHARAGMSGQEFANHWREYNDLGYRPIDVDGYPTPDGSWRYLAVWRQNTDRPDWPARQAVRDALDTYVAAEGLENVGISVVIMENGQFRFREGRGWADRAANKRAWSKTIYRTASVAKAITGIIAMQLQEEGVFDLDDPTRDHVTTLPVHHTHTLRNLLSMLGCVRGYISGDPVYGSEGYATATEALELFEDDALAASCTVGATYDYSTHAYTVFAAACEQALGGATPFSQILRERISIPFGIDTLAMEDRTAPSYERAEIYENGGSDPLTDPDDVTWKLAGGGMEVSPFDLARLGAALIDGEVLSEAQRAEMWTDPLPTDSDDFALGWNIGDRANTGRESRHWNGIQEGARSLWYVLPDEGVVLAVMVNRRWSGSDIYVLAEDIFDAMGY